MRRRAAIGIDNDLAAREARISVRPANDKAPGRIDVEIVFRAHPAVGQRLFDEAAHDFAHFLERCVLAMLG